MANEVDAHVRRKLKFTLTGVRHTQVHAEEAIEAAAALGQFLRIHQKRYREVVSVHRPAVAPVIAAVERATGSARRPAHGGQLLFLRAAEGRQQNRADRERKFCPEKTRTLHECRVYRFCTGNAPKRPPGKPAPENMLD